MKIAYLDPALSFFGGHNYAMLQEFDAELSRDASHQVTYLCSRGVEQLKFDDLNGRMEATFQTHGYAKLSKDDVEDTVKINQIISLIASELLHSQAFTECDAILMPTACPLHLAALSTVAERIGKKRLAVGFILPAKFWSIDNKSTEKIKAIFAECVTKLQTSMHLILYSEIGRFHFNERETRLPTLLPPLSEKSINKIRTIINSGMSAEGRQRKSIGFFGAPEPSKGIEPLLQAIRNIVKNSYETCVNLVLRLPPGFEKLCDELNSSARWIDAKCEKLSNADYLNQMHDVDLVWAFYDPLAYADFRMSGIVPDAIGLGKPVLISNGCEAIQAFIDTYAPGSAIRGTYSSETIELFLRTPFGTWEYNEKCAQISSDVILNMKSMRRYLAICNI